MKQAAYEQTYRYADRRVRNNRRRRTRELRRNIFLSLLTVCLVVTLAFSLNSFLSSANSGQEDITYKYYTSIQVAAGDTLWSIARENMGAAYASAQDYVSEVMGMNALQSDEISAGQYLIIPYYSTEFIR